MKRIFLTGGTGFLGFYLLAALHAENYEVIAATRGDIPSLPKHLLDHPVSWVTAEDSVSVIEKTKPMAIIHLATDYGNTPPLHETLIANEVWPLKLLEAGIAAGTQLFLNTDTFFAKPSFAYPHMRSYTLSKSGFLSWGKHAAMGTQTRFITLRLEHVFGENDHPNKFIPNLLRKLTAGEAVELTEGKQRRDFIHASDVASAYVTILQRYSILDPEVDEIEVGSGKSVALRHFVELAKHLCGSSSMLRFGSLPMRPNEIMESFADTSILKSLNWRCRLTLENALSSCIATMNPTER